MANEKHPEGKVLKRVGPAVRMIANGEPAWYLDFRYDDGKGKRPRFRKKADVQTQTGAVAEGEARKAKALRCGYPHGPLDGDGPAPVAKPAGPKPWAERTLREVVDVYLNQWAPGKLAHSTIETTKVNLKRLILPKFGDTPINKIDRVAVTTWDGELVKRGLASGTRRRLHTMLRSIICRCAVDLGWFTEAPRMPPLPPKSSVLPDVLTDDQVEALLAAAKRRRQRLALLLASDAGLRPAEVRELRWCDVQTQTWQGPDGQPVEELVLRVRRGFCKGQVTSTKTGKERFIPVTGRLAEALSKRGEPDALVTTSMFGERWGEKGLRDLFEMVERRSGLQGEWRFYDLRHYFCTTLFRAGVNVRDIMELMGHAELTTTLRYAHVVKRDLRQGIRTATAFRERQVNADSEPPASGVQPAHGRPMKSEAV